MDSSFLFDTINLWWSIVNTEGSNYKNNIYLSLKIVSVLPNGVDPNEMLHNTSSLFAKVLI